jgi:uncharacterized lipoprotein NlpE involved in copper resistance
MKKHIMSLLAVAFLVGGCANMQELSDCVIQERKAGKVGVTKVYPIPAVQAWAITEVVFRWEKTDEVAIHRTENYLITSTGMKMMAFGSVLGVWIEPVDLANTKITAIAKRRVDSDFFTNLTEATFFERFEQGLKIVQDGKELPVVSPEKNNQGENARRKEQ